jgi:hypothetical protein
MIIIHSWLLVFLGISWWLSLQALWYCLQERGSLWTVSPTRVFYRAKTIITTLPGTRRKQDSFLNFSSSGHPPRKMESLAISVAVSLGQILQSPSSVFRVNTWRLLLSALLRSFSYSASTLNINFLSDTHQLIAPYTALDWHTTSIYLRQSVWSYFLMRSCACSTEN